MRHTSHCGSHSRRAMLRVGGRDAGTARKWFFRRFDLSSGEREEGEKRGERKMGGDVCVCVCVCVCANESEREKEEAIEFPIPQH